MASSEANRAVTRIADSSILTGDIYKLVKVTGENTVGRAVAATDSPIGVLGENPAPAGPAGNAQVPVLQALPVTLLASGGTVKVKAGGTIPAGNLVVADANGDGVDGGADQAALAADVVAAGIALEAAVVGQIFEMQAQVQTSSTIV